MSDLSNISRLFVYPSEEVVKHQGLTPPVEGETWVHQTHPLCPLVTCSAVPRTLDISRKLLSDLAQVNWFKPSLSTGFVPNKAEYVLSQDGYPFPREESWIAKSIDLIFEKGKVAGPKQLYLLLVPLLEWKSEIDAFMKSRADLYPLGLSFTKLEHDIKSEGASTLRGGEDMGTSESSRRMVWTLCLSGSRYPNADGLSSSPWMDDPPS